MQARKKTERNLAHYKASEDKKRGRNETDQRTIPRTKNKEEGERKYKIKRIVEGLPTER